MDRCGFEGITVTPDGTLYLACKYPRHPQSGHVLLYRIESGPRPSLRLLSVDVQPLLTALRLQRLRPSGLVWLPDAGRLLVLAGKERVLMEVDATGRMLAWRRLSRRLHRQAEGLAILPDTVIAIADEGDGRRATVTLYGRGAN
jgi:uncharacterized protein YjiK